MRRKARVDWADRGRLLLAALLGASGLVVSVYLFDRFGILDWWAFYSVAVILLSLWVSYCASEGDARAPRRLIAGAVFGLLPWIALFAVYKAGWLPLSRETQDAKLTIALGFLALFSSFLGYELYFSKDRWGTVLGFFELFGVGPFKPRK